MRIRSTGATALYLLLLLTSLVEAAGHELLCHDEPTRFGIASGVSDSGAQIAPDGEEQGEDCPYCGLCTSRVCLAPTSASSPTVEVAEVRVAASSVFLAQRLPASHLSRGPPAC
ncbi:MAG: DUF2946 family protein [Acidobacteriota bacterium]